MTSINHPQVVIVTGASRGLGKKIALRFGRSGCRVVVNYCRREQEAIDVCDEIQRINGSAIPFRADVSNADDVEAMFHDALQRWNSVDVLVNNAGLVKDNLMLRMTEEDWDDVVDVNLRGPFLCIRTASRAMMKQRRGHIINISSLSGVQGRAGQANYSASKAGLIGLTKAAARELGRFNVSVNAVLPGYLETDMGGGISAEVRERVLQENALGRVSDPGEVADFIYYLSRMNNVSGQMFNLDSRTL